MAKWAQQRDQWTIVAVGYFGLDHGYGPEIASPVVFLVRGELRNTTVEIAFCHVPSGDWVDGTLPFPGQAVLFCHPLAFPLILGVVAYQWEIVRLVCNDPEKFYFFFIFFRKISLSL